jgi:hypothetical protein
LLITLQVYHLYYYKRGGPFRVAFFLVFPCVKNLRFSVLSYLRIQDVPSVGS